MNDQSHPFSEIILVDDASKDQTREIAESHGATVIRLTKQHPSYVGRPELATVCNHAFRYITSHRLPYDYLMGNGADTLLPGNYVEEMTRRMDKNDRLVISGGTIRGEQQSSDHVRGAGRFHKAQFWKNHVKEYPLRYIWESYPLYKARSLGYAVYNFPDLIMISQRQTTLYKKEYGFAMRELGYIPVYALARSIKAMLKDPRIGSGMLKSYFFGDLDIADSDIAEFIRSLQRRHLASLLLHPRQLLLRSAC